MEDKKVIQIEGHIFNLEQIAKVEINKESITIFHGSFKDTFHEDEIGSYGLDKLKTWFHSHWVDVEILLNDFKTTSMYWDCECKKNYIRSSKQLTCGKCGAIREDQPDSRIYEVEKAGLPTLPSNIDYDRLKDVLDEFEKLTIQEAGIWGISGGFAIANYMGCEDGKINIELKYGVQSDCEDSVTTENWVIFEDDILRKDLTVRGIILHMKNLN